MNIIHVKPNRFGNQYHGLDLMNFYFQLNLTFRVVFLIFWNILPYLCSFTMCINTWFIIFGIKRRHDLKNTQGKSLFRQTIVRRDSMTSTFCVCVRQSAHLSYSRCIQNGCSNDKFIFIDNGSLRNSVFQFMNWFANEILGPQYGLHNQTFGQGSGYRLGRVNVLVLVLSDAWIPEFGYWSFIETTFVKRLKDINPTSCRQQSLSYTVVSYLSFSSCLEMVSS